MNEIVMQHEWNKFDKRIAIIGNPNEFLAKGMGEAFKSRNFRVYLCGPTVTAISQLPPETHLYIYIVDSVSEHAALLTYLRDIIYERKICVFPICQKSEIAEIDKLIPINNLAKVYPRPVNAKEIVEEINNLYENIKVETRLKTVLIVDDDPEYLRHIQQILHKHYKTYIANSGASALMILSKYPADLVLLDYQMPVLDGVQTMEAIKTEPATANIPVMFLTGKQDTASVAKAVSLHPEKYILKTTAAHELLAILSDFFVGKQYEQKW